MSQNSTAAPQFSPPTADLLQNCLAYFMLHYRLDHSLTSLLSGLPMNSQQLSPALFVRAAQRANVQAKVVGRELRDLSPHVLPAVIELQGQIFAILYRLEGDSATLLSMKDGSAQTVAIAELAKVYAGQMILVTHAAIGDAPSSRFRTGREWFWAEVYKFKSLYTQVLLASIMINILGMVGPLYIMNVYDRVVPNAAFPTLWVLSLGVLLAYVFDFIFRQLRAYFIDTAGKGADILLASRLFQQILNARLGKQNASAGALANQIRDFESLRDFFTSSTLVTLIDLPFMLLFLAVLFLIAGPVAFVPMIVIPIVLGVTYFLQVPLQVIVQRSTDDMDSKHGHLVETLTGLETVKTLGIQSVVQHKWEQFVGQAANQGAKTRFLAQMSVHFCLFATQAATVFMVIWGTYRIAEGLMSVGALVASTILVGRAMAPLSQAVGLYVRYQQAKVSLAKLSELMALEVEREDGQNFVHKTTFKGKIEFRDVSFAYPGSKLASLANVSTLIQPGEKVGVIGRAGSGKSTFSRLVLNLYNPLAGSVLVDDIEIRQLDPAELRANISYVPQNVALFKGTLRDNLRLVKPDATEAELVAAATASGVIDFTQRHPMGFDLPIGEGGTGLSSGQKQAVGVARALLRAGDIYVFDDPTSEMDNRSEAHIKQALLALDKRKTMLLITHRAPLLEAVDRLIVIEAGKIVADGPKDRVLAMLNSGGKGA